MQERISRIKESASRGLNHLRWTLRQILTTTGRVLTTKDPWLQQTDEMQLSLAPETPVQEPKRRSTSPSTAKTPDEFLELAGHRYLRVIERNPIGAYMRSIDDPIKEIDRIEGEAMTAFTTSIINFFEQAKNTPPLENNQRVTYNDYHKAIIWGNRLFKKNSKNPRVRSLDNLMQGMEESLNSGDRSTNY